MADDKPERSTTTLNVSPAFAAVIRKLAAFRNKSYAEVLDLVCLPVARESLAAEVARDHAELSAT